MGAANVRRWGVGSPEPHWRQHQRKQTGPRGGEPRGPAVYKSGDTYSRACGTTIGSGSLTTVFGMGTGVTFQIWSPEISVCAAEAARMRGRGSRHIRSVAR